MVPISRVHSFGRQKSCRARVPGMRAHRETRHRHASRAGALALSVGSIVLQLAGYLLTAHGACPLTSSLLVWLGASTKACTRWALHAALRALPWLDRAAAAERAPFAPAVRSAYVDVRAVDGRPCDHMEPIRGPLVEYTSARPPWGIQSCQ